MLMKKGMTLKEAWSLVKKQRPAIGPHHYLKVQLVQYEIHLFGKATMKDYQTWKLDVTTVFAEENNKQEE